MRHINSWHRVGGGDVEAARGGDAVGRGAGAGPAHGRRLLSLQITNVYGTVCPGSSVEKEIENKTKEIFTHICSKREEIH